MSEVEQRAKELLKALPRSLQVGKPSAFFEQWLSNSVPDPDVERFLREGPQVFLALVADLRQQQEQLRRQWNAERDRANQATDAAARYAEEYLNTHKELEAAEASLTAKDAEIQRLTDLQQRTMADACRELDKREASLTALRREQEQLQQEAEEAHAELNLRRTQVAQLQTDAKDVVCTRCLAHNRPSDDVVCGRHLTAAEATGAAAVSQKDAEIERLRGELARVRQLLNDEVEYGPAHDD